MKSATLFLLTASLAAQSQQPSTIVTFNQGINFVPRSINNHGQIAGYYSPAPGQPTRGFLRSPDGTIQTIDAPNTLSTVFQTRLHGINDLGEIAGTTGPADNRRAFIRSANGEFIEITTFNQASIVAYGINNSGYVVGSYQLFSTNREAFLRNLAGEVVPIAGVIPDEIEAVAIANNTDRILVHRISQNRIAATHTSTATGSFSPLTFQPGGQPTFVPYEGNGINAGFAITGRVGNDGFLARVANPTTADITTVTDAVHFQLPGALITAPYGINDKNQIVGTLTNAEGQQTGFLLNPCSPTLTVTTRAHGSGAEAGLFDVTPPDARFCLWIADSTVPWVSFTRSVGNGLGTVAYSLQPNTTDTERQGHIRIGNTEFLITQAPSSCTYTVTPNPPTQLPPAGGTSTLNLITAAPNCPWTLSSPVPWARFVTPLSGTGNATVTVEVDPIPQTAFNIRAVSLNIAGVAVPISQGVPACTLELSSTTINAPAAGSLENVRVNASYPGCRWSAPILVNSDWVSYLNQTSTVFTGSNTISLRIAPNPGTQPRTRRIDLTLYPPTPFQTVVLASFTIQQAGASACSYSLPTETTTRTYSDGIPTTFIVHTAAGCPLAASSNVHWIRVLSTLTTSPTNEQRVGYQVDPNPSRFPRQGRITVEGLTYTINQQGDPSAELSFFPLTPCRILDTRPNQGFTGAFGPPAVSGYRSFHPDLRCGVPFHAGAIAFRFTALPLNGTLTYLSVSSRSPDFQLTSTLNSWDGRTVSNLAILPIGTSSLIPGSNTIYIFSTNPTHVIAEIIGYFAEPTLTSLVFYPVTPCRLLDTRTSGNAPIPAGTPRNLQVAGACGVPTNAAALSLNVTAIPRNTTLESLTVYPTGQTRPTAIPLNAAPGRVVANSTLLATGIGGGVTLHASHETDAVVDVNGYFSLPSDSGLYFTATAPCRIADTRINTGTTEGILLPGTIRTFTPATTAINCRIPANARAHLVNATVVPEGPTAFLSLFPSPTWTGSSTLNAYDGQVTANLAIVPDTGQGIGALASNPTHLVLDSSGYFTTLPVDLRRPVPIPLRSSTEQQ